MTWTLLSCLLLLACVQRVSLQGSDSACGTCNKNQFCFSGTQNFCLACNVACDKCYGPGPDECNGCQRGYQFDLNNVCTKCSAGSFGDVCNGTCHCLDDDVCDHATGECVGKCQKGYYKPPQCQDACPDGFYGLDCAEECHCFNDSVCDKVLGFCPGNLCHPNWVSFGCSKRLPKLSDPPEVLVATCTFFTVVWSAWNPDNDVGDLPVAEYWLYQGENTTGVMAWTLVARVVHDPAVTQYRRNVTGLQRDFVYMFRVDVHYNDDNKVVDKAIAGPISDPPTLVPCTTTTAPPPLTVPIIIGTDVFSTLSYVNAVDGSLVVQWSIDSELRRFTWNVTLSYQLVGTGNCARSPGGVTTIVPVNQTDSEFRLLQPDEWTKYRVELMAEGTGVISGVNGSKDIEVISAEILPSGNISDLRTSSVQSTAVTLTWTAVPCAQRGGKLVNYEVKVSGRALTKVVTSNLTSVLVEGLVPFTDYTASVRYVNNVGVGPFGEEFNFTTAEGAPSAVTISSLEVTTTTVKVNFAVPQTANGIVTEYYILYSDKPSFTEPDSATHNASSALSAVVERLLPETTYYFKVRAKTGGGYGPYGNVMQATTLASDPLRPSSLLQTSRNESCVTLVWMPAKQAALITGYTVTVVKVGDSSQGNLVPLPANATGANLCTLVAGATYNVSVVAQSANGASRPQSIIVTTEHVDPPAPPAPLLLNVSGTSAAVELEPVTFAGGPISAYQLEVERLPSNGTQRRRRLAQVPGYVTAQLLPSQLSGGQLFLIGDGQTYGGYVNRALEAGQTYRLYYVVLSTFNNVTKFAFTSMAQPINTPLPLTTAPSTTTTTTTVVVPVAPADDGDNGVLIGIIVALVLLLIIAAIVLFLIWWYRRRQSLLKSPAYFELDEGKKGKKTAPKEVYEPEKYWNQITSVRESRYIVVGRECLPDAQLVPVSTQMAQPGAKSLSFRREFQTLPHTFEQATTLQAQQHQARNRFPHILPYDHSLVPLDPDASSSCPYVNANFISGYNKQRCYVAAQSPFDDDTAIDFWRLICQHNVKTVVMIANVVEDNIVKCTQFWPREGKVSIGRFYLELQEEMEYADFVVRDISVRQGNKPHGSTVRLFEFTSWPDHGVPDDPIPFLDFRYKVRQYHGNEVGPILVHCGTGVARTGAFIAVDSLIDQYANEGRISVFSFVRKMRKERPLMVRTYKQYAFIYECILEEFQAGDTMTDALSLKPKYHGWTMKNTKTGHSFLRDQFQLLDRLTRGLDAEQCASAQLPHNVQRNRYPDVVPSDLHRPTLTTPAALSNTDYINAVFLDGYRKRNQFLITQTPLHTTLIDFWRMVYDYRVPTIVMMDNYKHGDDTCAEYWPSDVNMKQWEPFFVENTATFQQENVTVRNLKVVNTLRPRDAPHLVRQFQFNAWAENSFTPVSKTMALDLLGMVLDYHSSTERHEAPIVVHCEDGATHCGLFVALALLCERMDEEQEVDVYHTVKHLKRRRRQIVNDYNQFRFCYKALWDYVNLRMPGGTFTDTLGQNKTDKVYGVASLSLTSYQDSLY